jgi:prolyl-tRNA synthetase
MMKDLYSAHLNEKDLMNYYEKVKKAYSRIFTRLGFKFRVVEAAGGVFTDKNTHEFQVMAAGGEDTIYYCNKCSWAKNKEIFDGSKGVSCPECKKGKVVEAKAIEVANIFPLGTWYAERMRVYYQDAKGRKKPVWFGSYGIGSTRVMGAWVEVSYDEKGIIWNKAMAPFDVHLIELPGAKGVKKIYEKLTQAGIEVLYDDRQISAGEKFTDADLIGIPVRLVVSEKTGNKIEWKERTEETTESLSLDEVIKTGRFEDECSR